MSKYKFEIEYIMADGSAHTTIVKMKGNTQEEARNLVEQLFKCSVDDEHFKIKITREEKKYTYKKGKGDL